jgi:glucosamine--fructose-6-phosphate aminotransferase (isomerizing)
MMKYSGRMVHLNDGEIGVLCKDFVEVYTPEGKLVEKEIEFVSWDPVTAEKGGYTHFMLKEIHEQPRAIHDTFIGRMSLETGIINFDELKISQKELAKVKRIILTACGTSWHACLIGEYLIEQMAKIPVEVENAAEFRYRSPVLDKGTLVIAVSQSGETADTLGAVKEAHALGAKVLSICNVVGSSLARESDGIIYTRGGPEIGVASTKAFTTQLVVFYILSLLLSKLKKTMGIHEIKKHLKQLAEIPQKVETILQNEKIIEEISERYYQVTNALFLGRGKGYPIALEGALKLKEISYIHAEGYPAAEMKHGPIALIDENMPVVVLIFKGRRYEKILGNIEEVKARRGKIIAIASEGDTEIKNKADDVIYIPDSSEELSPILAVLPLQLFAYYAAVKRGCSIDQPRHLAKSVTVE